MWSLLKRKGPEILIQAGLLLICLIVLIPFAMVVLGAFKDPVQAALFDLSLPKHWYFENFQQVFIEGNFLNAMFNSLKIILASVPFTILISAPCALYLGRISTKLSRRLHDILTVGVYLPVSIIPSLVLMKFLDINGTIFGISLIYIAIRSSWSIFLLTGFVRTIPRELDEAAIVDGCGPLRLLFWIVVPLMRPILLTCIIIITMWNWNDFHLPLYFLSSNSTMTLPMTVYYFYGGSGSSWNLIFANLLMASLPIIIIFFFCQRYIVSGLTSGAVKG